MRSKGSRVRVAPGAPFSNKTPPELNVREVSYFNKLSQKTPKITSIRGEAAIIIPMEKKHILLTNDDGIESPGLWAAAQALAPLGFVHVVEIGRAHV